jgi:hypothetical protein
MWDFLISLIEAREAYIRQRRKFPNTAPILVGWSSSNTQEKINSPSLIESEQVKEGVHVS